MNKQLEHMLRCPITKGPLREMKMSEIKEVNDRISKGELLHFDGTVVERHIGSGFVSLNGCFVYPIEEDIVILLQNLAVVINNHWVDRGSKDSLRKGKKDVRDFYDQVGWQRGEEGLFVDALLFEDLRPVSRDYIHKCHMRVTRHLKHSGRYILDAASGPIQYPEYLSYSSNFDLRICADISFSALKEAKTRLGSKGIYLLADITDLPLVDNLVDAVISLHTIYHLSEDEQSLAFREIYRVLKPGCSAVVVYSWGHHSFLTNLTQLPFYVFKASGKTMRLLKALVERKLLRKSLQTCGPRLHFHAHNYKYFRRRTWEGDFKIFVWRSVSTFFTKTYIQSWLLGKQALALIYWFEERFPCLAGRLGAYPMFIISK